MSVYPYSIPPIAAPTKAQCRAKFQPLLSDVFFVLNIQGYPTGTGNAVIPKWSKYKYKDTVGTV